VPDVGFGCGSLHEDVLEENYCSCRDNLDGGACHSLELVLSWAMQTSYDGLVMEWTLASHLLSTVHHLHELDVPLEYYRHELPTLQQLLPLLLLLFRYDDFDGGLVWFGE
jgi:hypothetical protein